MMYAATLLASLLASAHGFASNPALGASPTACFLDGVIGEKFFVFSRDFSLLYPYLEIMSGATGGDLAVPPDVTRGLPGKTWEGLQLSITKGDISITQAGGLPLTVTSPNEIDVDLSTMVTKGHPTISNAAYVSEDFCLPHGEWTVKMNGEPTYNYTAIANEPITYPPAVEVGNNALMLPLVNDTMLGFQGEPLYPFRIWWEVYPASLREEAVEALAGPYGGLDFPSSLNFPPWAYCGFPYEKSHVVPAPHAVGRRLSSSGERATCS